MRTPGSAAELEARRRRAAEYFQERRSLQEIATRVEVSLTSVKCWKRTWKTEGVDGLAAKPHPGPSCRLTEEQRQSLVGILLKGPIAAGYRTDLWTCARVAEVVRKRFRVSRRRDHMRRILHDLGFSPQKPRLLGLARNWYLRKKRQMATFKSYFSRYSRRMPDVTSQFDRSRMECNPGILASRTQW
jgi:putative transposase